MALLALQGVSLRVSLPIQKEEVSSMPALRSVSKAVACLSANSHWYLKKLRLQD